MTEILEKLENDTISKLLSSKNLKEYVIIDKIKKRILIPINYEIVINEDNKTNKKANNENEKTYKYTKNPLRDY